MEKRFGVQLFDRQLLAFYIEDKVQVLPMAQLTAGLSQGVIQPETLYFNNTVLTKRELETSWIIPLKDSWLGERIPVSRQVSQ